MGDERVIGKVPKEICKAYWNFQEIDMLYVLRMLVMGQAYRTALETIPNSFHFHMITPKVLLVIF